MTDGSYIAEHPEPMLDRRLGEYANGLAAGSPEFRHLSFVPEDQTGHYFLRIVRAVVRILRPVPIMLK